MPHFPEGVSVDHDGSAFDALPYPACILDAHARVQAVNARARRLLGVSREEFLGRSLLDGIELQADSSARASIHRACAERIVFTGEVLFRRPQGDAFWNDIILVPRGGGDEMLAIFRDVTARRTAEHALGERGGSDRALLDRLPAGIVIHAADTSILYANAKATELLGIAHDDALLAKATDEHWDFVGDDDQPMRLEDFPVNVILRTKAAAHGILVGQRRASDGKRVWVMCSAYPLLDASGDVTEVIVSFVDVTQLKETERALAKSQERLRLVLEGSRDAPWDWDIRTGEVYYSPRYLEMVGLGPEQAGDGFALWTALMVEEDRERVGREFNALLQSDVSTYEIEFNVRHASGRTLRVLSRGFILRDADGQAVRVSGTNTDVTERRALEQRVRQSQKLEAIGHLAGGVAHDFNNVLAVMLGNLEILQAEVEPGSVQADCLEDLLAAAHRGADLTKRLLSFSRQQPLAESLVDVRQVVLGLERMLGRLLGETVRLGVYTPADVPAVRVDAGQLENALVNLCINARDAMPEGGTLHVTVDVMPPGATRAQYPELSDATYVRISLADTGTGMTPDVATRALEPFFTTKPPGQGTGLGLSMVYGFARQSGGTLAIASTPGRGTTVDLLFPVAQEPAQALAPQPPAPPAVAVAPAERRTVLVAEDEEAVRRLCVRTLERLGYATLQAQDGPSAVKILESAQPIDLLLSDVVMPGGMSGRDLARRARELRPGLPILHMSGYPAHVFDDLLADDRDRLLRKPFAVEDLRRAIAEVMAGTR